VRRAIPPLCLAAAILFAACGGASAGSSPSAAAGSAAASEGGMSAGAAAEAVAALCDLRVTTDPGAASATFFDRAHSTLHELAAATQTVDRGPAAELLESKQVVEADLRSDTLPASFRQDVEELLAAARAALDTIGSTAPDC
jgi:hypothetical protein